MTDELRELQKIAKILVVANSDRLTKAISRFATTSERKKIWVLIDGTNMPKDIARKVGKIKRRAVELFLEELERAGFVSNPKRKAPVRLLEFVPPDWVKLVHKKESSASRASKG